MAEITLIEQPLGDMILPCVRSLRKTQKRSQPRAIVLRTIKYCKGLVQSKVEEKKDEKKEAAEACTGVPRQESNWRSRCC